MNKNKLPKWLIVAGVAMLGVSLSGTAAAALSYYSQNYIAQMDVKSIGVTLNENNTPVSWRNYLHSNDAWDESTGALLTNMLSDAGDSQLILNKRYDENLSVTNSGTIDEYVRVEVYHYWVDVDEEGNQTKRTDIDPDNIVIGFTDNSGWLEDTSAQTSEKNVLYYSSILEPGETTADFTDYIYISGEIAYKVSESTTTDTFTDEDGVTHKYSSTVTTYDYDGVSFVLRADVDAVQTHNAEDAIMSAWGVGVSVDDNGTIKLKR